MDDSSSVSPALLAAQAELNKRRVAELAKTSSKSTLRENSPSSFSMSDVTHKLSGVDAERPLVLPELPPHLGWGVTPPALPSVVTLENSLNSFSAGVNPKLRPLPDPLPETIKVFGHVLDGFHRQGDDSLGRVWLLLRVLDRRGEGRVPVALVREEVTGDNGRLPCYSWRRLRQLLQQGENRFWHRDKKGEYIYYHSEARVAKALDIGRIRGWAVEIPVSDLLGSVAEIRALFHDCFHSARGDGFNDPITRRVMESRGGGDPRTQRKYERLRGVESRANYANMGEYSKEALAWHQGLDAEIDFDKTLGPAFTFVDFDGSLGKSHNREQRPKHQQHWHKIYILRQMANTYEGTLRTVKRGRKWTNRKLTHLCNTKKLRGSCEETTRLYYGAVAGTTFGRNMRASQKLTRSPIRGEGVMGDARVGERPLQSYFVAQSDVIWQVNDLPFDL